MGSVNRGSVKTIEISIYPVDEHRLLAVLDVEVVPVLVVLDKRRGGPVRQVEGVRRAALERDFVELEQIEESGLVKRSLCHEFHQSATPLIQGLSTKVAQPQLS